MINKIINIKALITWQVVIIIITLLSPLFLPLRETYLGGATQAYLTNPVVYSRGNFDGNYFVYIAERGYGYALEAFFPLYPQLIKFFNQAIHNSYYSGVLISLMAFTLGYIYFVKLVSLDYDTKSAKYITLLILFFPVSFYFSFIYTEGLFFLLCIASFYYARKKNWIIAAILGAFASYTKFLGIALLPSLVIEYWTQNKKINLVTLKKFIPLMLIPVGLLTYMNYLFSVKGDPLAFYSAQQLFGQDRSSTKIILLYQVFWRYIKMLFTVNRYDFIFITILIEFITGIAFTITSIYSFIKQRKSYAVFNAIMFLTPTLTGSFTSIARYVLLCFPSFMVMGDILSKQSNENRNVILISLGVLFTILLSLFVRGYWVA